ISRIELVKAIDSREQLVPKCGVIAHARDSIGADAALHCELPISKVGRAPRGRKVVKGIRVNGDSRVRYRGFVQLHQIAEFVEAVLQLKGDPGAEVTGGGKDPPAESLSATIRVGILARRLIVD